MRNRFTVIFNFHMQYKLKSISALNHFIAFWNLLIGKFTGRVYMFHTLHAFKILMITDYSKMCLMSILYDIVS